MRFTYLGVGTPATKANDEAPGGELCGGLEAEEFELMQSDLLQDSSIALGNAIDNMDTTKYDMDTKWMQKDCWAGIDIPSTLSMRTTNGSLGQNLDVALMVAGSDHSDADSSADGSVGMEPDLSSAAFHDHQLEGEGTAHMGRPTDIYVPAPEEYTNSTVFDQLR